MTSNKKTNTKGTHTKVQKQKNLDTAPIRHELLQYITDTNCTEFIKQLDDKTYKTILNLLIKAAEKDSVPLIEIIQSFENGFHNTHKLLSPEDKTKAQKLFHQFNLAVHAQNRKQKYNPAQKLKTQQTLNALNPEIKTTLAKISDFIEEKTSFNINEPMKSLQKMLPGNSKSDPTKTVKDSDVDIGTQQIPTMIQSEALGRIFGSSIIASQAAGVIAPILPIWLIGKTLPDTIPIIGGVKTDTLLSEKTTWNPIDKNTKTKIGENKTQEQKHTNRINEQNLQNNKSSRTR